MMMMMVTMHGNVIGEEKIPLCLFEGPDSRWCCARDGWDQFGM